jgi:hypothetical protein
MILFEKSQEKAENNYNVYYVVRESKQFIGQIDPDKLEEQVEYYKKFKNHVEIN